MTYPLQSLNPRTLVVLRFATKMGLEQTKEASTSISKIQLPKSTCKNINLGYTNLKNLLTNHFFGLKKTPSLVTVVMSPFTYIDIFSPLKFNIPLKNDGWKTTFFLTWCLFRGHVDVSWWGTGGELSEISLFIVSCSISGRDRIFSRPRFMCLLRVISMQIRWIQLWPKYPPNNEKKNEETYLTRDSSSHRDHMTSTPNFHALLQNREILPILK